MASSVDSWAKTFSVDRKNFNMFFERMMDGFAYHKIIVDNEGKPVDYVFLEVNSAFEKMTGLTREKIIGKKVTEVLKGIENDPADWIGKYGKAALSCEPAQFENFAEALGKWYSVSAYCPDKGYFVAIFEDITERKKAEEALRQSNETLEQRIHERTVATVNERQRLFQVLETLPSYVVLLDKNYQVNFANKVFRELFGESKGRPCYEFLFKRDSPCESCETYKVQKTKKRHRWEWTGPNGHDYDIYDFPFIDQDGSMLILEMGLDITDRKHAEAELKKYQEHLEKLVAERTDALRESEQRWATTLSSIGDAVIATDTKGLITFMNPVAEKITGWTLGEVKQKPIGQVFNIINEQTRKEVESPVQRVLEKGVVVGLANHTVLIRKDGTEVPIDDSGAPIVTEGGEIHGVVLVFRDITQRKKAEEALRESAERLKRSQAIAHLGSWELDLKEDKLFWSDEVYKIFGLKPQEFEATYQAFLATVHPDDRADVDAAYNNSVRKRQEGYEIEHRIVRHDSGQVRFIYEKCTHVRDKSGKVTKSLGMVHDITETKQYEDALKRQAALIDLSPDAIIVRDLDGPITFWSRGAEKLYGWTKKEAIGKSIHELLQTKFPQPFAEIVAELNANLKWTGELAHKTKSGLEVVVQSWWLAEQTEQDGITSILESNVDLTQRKKAEKEIERLASFPILNPSPVVEVNAEGKFTFINPAAKALFPDLERLGIRHSFFFDWANVSKAFADKNTGSYGREVKINGHWYHQQLYLVPRTKQIRIYCADIDELKQTEEARAKAQMRLEENAIQLEEYASQMEELAVQRAHQLKNAERMAAIGQTAGMVGHDIRNPLQAITSDMYLIAEEAKAMPEGESKQSVMESIQSVNDNLIYINKIVSDLQDYTRPLKPNLQNVNLWELLEGTLLTIKIPDAIEVTTDIKDNAKLIKTDVAYLRRIMTNIITNGVQAMQDKGKLTIKAAKNSDVVTIRVHDTGVGIPQDAKDKLFTPLFTTKSKGQGLGLAVVKRLIEGLGGTIRFDSEENKGTEFIIELPQQKQP